MPARTPISAFIKKCVYVYNFVFSSFPDLFTYNLFTVALQQKSAKSVSDAFDKIWKEAGVHPTSLETDQGTEFVGNRKYFEDLKIYFRTLRGKHKAGFAEHGIFIVKRKLYMLLRSRLSQNWPKNLQIITDNLNSRSLPTLGGLCPKDVRGREFDPEVDSAKDKAHLTKPTLSFEEKEKNQKKYEADPSKKLQVGAYVYAALKDDNFYKSFDIQRATLYKIRRVDASEPIPLFYLSDLLDKPITAGTFYKGN